MSSQYKNFPSNIPLPTNIKLPEGHSFIYRGSFWRAYNVKYIFYNLSWNDIGWIPSKFTNTIQYAENPLTVFAEIVKN